MIRNYLQGLSGFKKNVLTLATGTMLAQSVPLLASPFLTRLYTPEAFGILAMFTTVVGLFSTVAGGRFELAIPIPKEEDTANQLMGLGILTNILMFCFLLVLALTPFSGYLLELSGFSMLENWLYIVPFSVFGIGMVQIMTNRFVRSGGFSLISKGKVMQSLVNSGSKLGLAFLKLPYGEGGLILGTFAGSLVSCGYLLKHGIGSIKQWWRKFNLKRSLKLGRQYSDFLFVNSSHAFADILFQTILIAMIAGYFGEALLGFYAFSFRMLRTPVQLVAESMGRVVFQKFSALKNEGKRVTGYFKKILFRLILAGIVPLIILLIFGPELFSLVFGAEWETAGVLASIMGVWIFFVYLMTPFSHIPIIFDKQRTNFGLNLANQVVSLFLLFFTAKVYQDLEFTLLALTISNSVFYVIQLFWFYSIIKKRVRIL